MKNTTLFAALISSGLLLGSLAPVMATPVFGDVNDNNNRNTNSQGQGQNQGQGQIQGQGQGQGQLQGQGQSSENRNNNRSNSNSNSAGVGISGSRSGSDADSRSNSNSRSNSGANSRSNSGATGGNSTAGSNSGATGGNSGATGGNSEAGSSADGTLNNQVGDAVNSATNNGGSLSNTVEGDNFTTIVLPDPVQLNPAMNTQPGAEAVCTDLAVRADYTGGNTVGATLYVLSFYNQNTPSEVPAELGDSFQAVVTCGLSNQILRITGASELDGSVQKAAQRLVVDQLFYQLYNSNGMEYNPRALDLESVNMTEPVTLPLTK